jgi:hypothetical protein
VSASAGRAVRWDGTKVTRPRGSGPYPAAGRIAELRTPRTVEDGITVADELRRLEELTPHESMRLLRTVPVGRIVFTARALPAIRPVCHLVEGDDIVIRADDGAPIVSALKSASGSVVAYEADVIGPAGQLDWSVTVIGVARRVTDPDESARYRRALRPWTRDAKDQIISIHADVVRGFRLVADTAHPRPAPPAPRQPA